ncbi:aspartic peptidase domain-containing protein [Thelonectria olida]|uniref:Aspartic peptidase domain-containing protein n=1 Tax=Thelonectria olida TaxID=1576542 RepID=A0A9P8VXL1_9HYPO|nr:aspartic peptidase domain-containing protein [Thelonectria olida]
MNLVRSLLAPLALICSTFAGVPSLETRHADWDLSMPMNGVSFERLEVVSKPVPDRASLRFSRLRSIKGNFEIQEHPGASSSQNTSAVGAYSTQYAIQCYWDGTPAWLVFDTGSSDTWAVHSEFRCEDMTGHKHPRAACAFGRPYIGDFGAGEIDGVHFHLSYGSGEEVSGPMGKSNISCGGLSVPGQQVGLANKTYWRGNNVTVGLLGLAYKSLTNAYYGSMGEEKPWSAIPYTPFLTRAISQGTTDPVFSVAIMRNSSDGILAWGGLPPIVYNRKRKATTDLIIANLADKDETSWTYSYYTIVPDGVTWGERSDTTRYPYIVDTGTTMMHLPPPLVETIATAFEPSAMYVYQWGSYFVPCDAIPPPFAIVISGVEFWINPADLIHQDLIDPLTGYCACGITSGGAGPYILGHVFLQNVLAVFDVGGAEMRFYARD